MQISNDELPDTPAPKTLRNTASVTMRCPVEDTGRYSVKPSTIPRMTAKIGFTGTTIAGRASFCGADYAHSVPPRLCPCTSGNRYAECCARYHRLVREPPDAVALMRSRYAAFASKEIAYLWRTLHRDHE